MLRWISQNYRTFLWSLALSMAVWMAAVTSADPDETRVLSSPIPVQIVGQDPGLVIRGDIPENVQLTLRAPSSVWNLINGDVTIVKAVLDLSGLSEGEHNAELQIQIDARPVQIVAVAPQAIEFNLEPLATRTLNVGLSLSGEAAIGYQIGDPDLQPATVIISGAQSQVHLATRARVVLNLNRIRENVDQDLLVEVLDENGQAVNGITVSPSSIGVRIPVIQQGGYRDVAVKVVTTGRVASGYRLTDLSVFPPVVTVFSTDPQRVNDLPGILETQPLDLQNAQNDISTRLGLGLPAGVSIVGEQTVLIQAGVSPIESSITLAGEKVEIIGLSSKMTAQVSPQTVDVIVSGPLPILDTLTRQDVRVTVDLTGLESGVQQVTPAVEVLIADVVVQSILPNTIEVVITVLGAPTVAPTP
jgi:YbbR domain-containing protein